MIKVEKLKKIYKMGKNNSVIALDGLSFELQDSEVLALIGSSGSGKSSFLNVLGGLDTKYQGKISVNDKDIRKYDQTYYRRFMVGTIFQQFYLIPKLDVLENIMLPISFGKQLKKQDAKERAKYLLDKVGLYERRNHKPSELSGGQAQRVAIARALMAKPSLLLADEPTGNLDSKTGEQILDLMMELNKEEGSTMIIVSHDVAIANRIKKKIILRDGKNVADN